MRTTHLAAMAVLALPAGGAVPAQSPADDGPAPALREYRDKLPLLIERYSTDRKIRYHITHYAFDPVPGRRPGDVVRSAVREVVTDGRQLKLVTLESRPEQPEKVAQFWRPDTRFDVSKKGDGFEVTEQHSASSNYYGHEGLRYNFFTLAPLHVAGNAAGMSLLFDPRARGRVLLTAEEVKPSTWRGRPCVEVRLRWDNRHGMIERASAYLDPDRDYVVIASEAKRAGDGRPHHLVQEVEYRPSAEGFPLPRASRRYCRFDDGTTCKVWDVEYLSYDRYVPAAADFQLEKAYGLTTPVVPSEADPAPAPAAREWRVWPWVAGAAGALLAVLGAFLIRRHRGPAPPPSSPEPATSR
jgi:hypothetical protein